VPRFPIKRNEIVNQRAVIRGPDYNHIIKVLRLKPGNDITLYDNESTEHLAKIKEVSSKEIKVAITKSNRIKTESELNITLLQAFPKGYKMDYIVAKATELGAKAIIPVVTDRSQVRKSDRSKRWEKIANEASKQCGRVIQPEISPLKNFRGAIETENHETLRLIFYENSRDNIKGYFRNNSQHPNNIIMVIGPEGGSQKEKLSLQTNMVSYP